MKNMMRYSIVLIGIAVLLSACFPPGVGGGGPELPPIATCPPCPSVEAPQTPTNTTEAILPTASPSIIEVTPLGGFPDYVAVAEFTIETIVRQCSPEALDLFKTPQAKSPSAYCPPFVIGGHNSSVEPGFATDVIGFYKVNNGELWGVISYKDGRVIALCYRGASRAKVWLHTSLYELDENLSSGYDWQYACTVEEQ